MHQLHARDDTDEAAPATNVVELAAPVDWGTTQVEPDPRTVEVPETAVEEEPAAESEALEPVPAQAEPEEKPLLVEARVVPEEEPLLVEAQVEHVEEPQPAEVILTEFHEALLAEVGYANEVAPEADPRTACVAFAPTTDGYRLVALEAAPEPGQTIDIAEVGEYLVLRVGPSPIPGDDRRCAYVEERVTPALIGAAAH